MIYLPQHFNAAWFFDAMSLDGNGSVAGDFATVTNLTDITRKGNTLTQSNSSLAPFYRLRTQQNKNTFSVNSSKYMTAPSINYSGEITIMGLVECDVSLVTTTGNIVSYGSNGGVSLGNGTSTFSKARLSCNGVGNFETTNNIFFNGQFCVITAVLKNTSGTWTVDFYKNGAFVETVAAAAPVASSDNFCMACRSSSGNEGWLGQIEMIAGWHRRLSSWELNQMHIFFNVRAGLAT